MKRINKQVLIIISIITLNLYQTTAYSQIISAIDSVYLKLMEDKANNYFEKTAYVKAIQIYDDLGSKGYTNNIITRNSAIANYKIGETAKSEILFRTLIDSQKYEPSDVFFYVQSLKYNQKYDEADIWIEKYIAMNSSDLNAKELSGSANFIKKLMEQERYKIELLNFNSSYSDFGASDYFGSVIFTSARKDQSVIRFEDSWKQTPYFDLYLVNNQESSAKRAELFERKFNTLFHDGPVCLNSTGDEVFVTRNNYKYKIPKKSKEGINNLKILVAKKTALNTWSAPEEMSFNSNDYSCGHPSISSDGNTLYFSSNMPGGIGGTDIYFVTRDQSGWSKPQNMGNQINTSENEMFPFIGANNYLYFSSNGHQGMGGLDIFISRRNNDGSYSLRNMGYPINSSADDFSIFLKNDNRTGYFASNRKGGIGDDDIYSVLITNPILFSVELQGVVVDSITGEDINSSSVCLVNSNQVVLDSINSLGVNTFSFDVEADQKYQINVSHEGYKNKSTSVDISKVIIDDGIAHISIALSKIPEWGIYGNVFIQGTKEVVSDVRVQIKNMSGDLFSEILTSIEDFKQKLEPNTDYELLFEKQGFLTKRAVYSTVNRDAGYVNINEFVDISIEKLELNKTIEIPNIYYDLGKWNIRADAAVELDKVVTFLNDNPTINVELGSHTDARGSDSANQTLSQKRAQSAVDYIIKKGIVKSRINAVGYGETKLKNNCTNGVKCSEVDHQENRRTEIKIVSF